MRVRPAEVADASALGHVMVTSWLAAHRDHVPEVSWQARVVEWTPEVSAAGWARTLSEDDPLDPRHVLLVAEDVDGLVGLVLATRDADDPTIAEVDALYVLPSHHRRGAGRLLLRHAAAALRARGCTRLTLGVLTANREARAFYEALGGRAAGERVFDEGGHLLPETVYAWDRLEDLSG